MASWRLVRTACRRPRFPGGRRAFECGRHEGRGSEQFPTRLPLEISPERQYPPVSGRRLLGNGGNRGQQEHDEHGDGAEHGNILTAALTA